jgi:hypothetical protein
MGLGDEIMALGRAERIFEETGRPVSIRTPLRIAREHPAWVGNPAWEKNATKMIIDGASARPYIIGWRHRRAIYNLSHRPRAGKIWLTDQEKDFCKIDGEFAIVAPTIKTGASPNKAWGMDKWKKVVKSVDMPVYQLIPDNKTKVLDGAIPIETPDFRLAASVISKAKFVMCNEGGTHHMAASMGVPAVVIFGAFVPPSVTGYDFHRNISIETEQGYCGNWDKCSHCDEAMKKITVEMVKKEVHDLMGSL